MTLLEEIWQAAKRKPKCSLSKAQVKMRAMAEAPARLIRPGFVLGRTYSESETKALLRASAAELKGMSYFKALRALYKNHEFTGDNGSGKWDFGVNAQWRDRFTIGRRILDAAEFTNYHAGYVSTARFGGLGETLTLLGGHYYKITDLAQRGLRDDALDQALIRAGAAAAYGEGALNTNERLFWDPVPSS